MAWLFCTSGAAIQQAGLNVNANIASGAIDITALSNYVEGNICMQTRRDWITSFATLPTAIQNALGMCEMCMVANHLIKYDMAGYTSEYEAGNMLNINFDDIQGSMKMLTDFKSNTLQVP